MKSLGIMRGESHFRLIFGRSFGSLVSPAVSSEGVFVEYSFRKSIQFRGFCVGVAWRGSKR